MTKQGDNDRRTWSCLGCGSLVLGILALFAFRDVGATDDEVFQGSWLLIVIGVAVLIFLLVQRLRRP
jgi:hypothetical protein